MAAEKTISLSIRVSPRFKTLLEDAAACDNRSLTNMLETLLFVHCAQFGLSASPVKGNNDKGAKK